MAKNKPPTPLIFESEDDFDFNPRQEAERLRTNESRGPALSERDDEEDGLNIIIDDIIDNDDGSSISAQGDGENIIEDDEYDGNGEEFYTEEPACKPSKPASARQKKKRLRIPNSVWETAKQVIGLILCVYMALLVYGSFITDYVYDETGLPVPRELSMDYLQKRDEYTTLQIQLASLQNVYERILDLNYCYEQGTQSNASLSMGYEKILNDLDVIIPKVRGAELVYARQGIDMMVSWLANDTAFFLQFVKAGLSQGTANDMANAEEYIMVMNNDYLLIQQYIKEIARALMLEETDTVSWTPDAYWQKLQMEGVNG